MNKSVVGLLEKEISSVQTEHEKIVARIQEVDKSVIALTEEKNKLISNATSLAGSFNAYQNSLKIIKQESAKEKEVETQEEVVN